MAAEAGRDLRIEYASDGSTYVAIGGARQDSFTINNEMIDITDKDDAGVRTLLDDVAVKSMSLSCTGVTKSSTYAALALAAGSGTALHAFRVTVGSFATYTGSFFIDNFEKTAEQADTITYTMSLQSSGTITAS
jgi:TP901-1 family phage major tail protein